MEYKMSPSVLIKPFNIKEASHAEYAALNAHSNLLRAERLPDDPPIPLEESIQNLQNIPPFVDVKMWCAWDDGLSNIVAEGDIVLLRTEDNRHMAQFTLEVNLGYRRQGIARQLIGLIADAAHADSRRLLITETIDRIPAGEVFMNRLGGQKGLVGHVNQLRIDELDHRLLARWQERGHALGADFELGLWDGPYPEEQLDAIVQLFEVNNQQPFGDIEIEDMHMTPKMLRQSEQSSFARGNQRWTFYVVERSTGRFAGYTETVWNPNRPEILRQDMTGVFPEYRNKGLGRWLKAVMLEKVLADRPQVKFVRTGNADVNAAMLKINNELGFKPYHATGFWQVEVDHIMSYLNERNA
jgi:mycothiol synthase